jgi:hypothetical protein
MKEKNNIEHVKFQSVECRLEEKYSDLKTDLKEIREDQKRMLQMMIEDQKENKKRSGNVK